MIIRNVYNFFYQLTMRYLSDDLNIVLCLGYVTSTLRVGVYQVFGYNYFPPSSASGYAVAQLIEALRYKPEGREFDSR